MKPGKVGVSPTVPYGFNADGSEPAPQGPYYTGAGTGIAIGRPVADEHLAKCLKAGVKIAGINAEVMPGQWEYQIGPCRGVEIGDHMTVAVISCCVSQRVTIACVRLVPSREMAIGMAQDAILISPSRRCEIRAAMTSFLKSVKRLVRKPKNTSPNMERGTINDLLVSMRHAASRSSNLVLLTVERLFASLEMLKRMAGVTWKIAALRPIATHTV